MAARQSSDTAREVQPNRSSSGKTKERQCWQHIRLRCCDPKRRDYRWYGGRGIRVCDRWLNSFEAFLADMGPAPSPEHSIDRINNDGNYEPGNCRWATRKEQWRNRSDNHRVAWNGEEKTIEEWAETLGIGYYALYSRLVKSNWPVELAFTTPVKSGQKVQPCNRKGEHRVPWCNWRCRRSHVPSVPDVCPSCQAPTGGQLFCPQCRICFVCGRKRKLRERG
jgi:hypothetical protein